MQVRMNIVWFCGRAVIDIAPDVAVELLFFQLCNRQQFAVFVERPSVPVDISYLLDIFGAQGVEKNPVRHNHRHAPRGFERADDMLDKHEIGFALGRHPEFIAIV